MNVSNISTVLYSEAFLSYECMSVCVCVPMCGVYMYVSTSGVCVVECIWRPEADIQNLLNNSQYH